MSYMYLASPYTHDDPYIIQRRFVHTREAVALLTRQNVTVYSPIVHFHELARHYVMPSSFDFWKQHNCNMIRHCNVLAILTLPGWEESKGVKWERDFAHYCNIPIFEWSLKDIRSGKDLLKLA